jgi:SpoVK/Ycf46/Vps4 family AAA+-type ATPase
MDEDEIMHLASITKNYSGADLHALVTNALLLIERKGNNEELAGGHFESAFSRMRLKTDEENSKMMEKYRIFGRKESRINDIGKKLILS